jgi:hemolysin III
MYRGERFNGYTHLAGAVLALAGAVALVVLGALRADPWRVVSFSVYGCTLVTLYLASTLYHSTRGRAKSVFRKLDHVSIYLLIAGTYTPFALVTLKGAWGWTLFAAAWSLALVGIAQELWLARGARVSSLVIYLLMGWLSLAAMVPLVERLSWGAFAWLLGGGLAYTAGIVFYVYDERVRHFHGVWHLFVLGGSAAHYIAIVAFVA